MREKDAQYEPGPGVTVSTLAYDYPAGFDVVEHSHKAHQLVFAPRGVMEIAVGRQLWLVPPQFAVWIPSRTEHRIRMPTAVSMRTLYFRMSARGHDRRHCAVIQVSPLLRELILECVRLGGLR